MRDLPPRGLLRKHIWDSAIQGHSAPQDGATPTDDACGMISTKDETKGETLKEWTVWNKAKTGIFITFPDWCEREAREWMKEHEKYVNMPGSDLEGAILEIREFETKTERHARYLQEIANHHEEQRAMWESVGDSENARYHVDRRNIALFGLDHAGNRAA